MAANLIMLNLIDRGEVKTEGSVWPPKHGARGGRMSEQQRQEKANAFWADYDKKRKQQLKDAQGVQGDD